jgi:septation ring formation regulator
MYWLIVLIILIIVVGIIGSLYRKKFMNEVNRLEDWKVHLMNKPIVNDIAKMKELNVSEHTKQAVEQWALQWEHIVNKKFPDVEELLFDIEEMNQRYQFTKIKHLIAECEAILLDIENKIEKISVEIKQHVNSKEKNELDENEVKDLFKEVKQQLLANHHTFGTAVLYFESELAEIKKEYQEYLQKNEDGLYIDARTSLTDVKTRLINVQEMMEVAPNINDEIQTIIPQELKTLKDGFEEMLEQGFYLAHIPVEKELAALHSEMKKIKKLLASADIDSALEEIKSLKEKIDLSYQLLENEATSKSMINGEVTTVSELLENATKKLQDLKVETESVKLNYHIDIDDLHTSVKLEEELKQLEKKFLAVTNHIQENDKEYSALYKELEKVKENTEELLQSQLAFQEMLHTLRKDELYAKEILMKLKLKIQSATRAIEKSNMPGIPDSLLNDLEYTEDKMFEVFEQLQKTPLQMSVINNLLTDATTHVEKSYDKALNVIEHAELTEKYIQYCNKYRSRLPDVAAALQQAENEFRAYNYSESYEIAKEVLLKVNPELINEMERTEKQEEVELSL